MASPPSQGGAPGGSELVSATFSTSGGTVTASCQASTVDPVSASQPDGNTVAVLSPGPSDVEVDFKRHSSAVVATGWNGEPVRLIEE